MFGSVVPRVPQCYLRCDISGAKALALVVSLEPRLKSSLSDYCFFFQRDRQKDRHTERERKREKIELYNRRKSSTIFLKYSFSILSDLFLGFLFTNKWLE
jgi:hypothetical protein